MLWRKFLNAGKFYEAQVLVMGGDITGKGVVPIVDTGHGFRAEEVTGKELFDESQVPSVEKRVRDIGFYPYRIAEADLEAVYTDERAVDEVFRQVMRDSVARWMALAEERLAGSDIKLFVMIGNDDDVSLREVIAASSVAVDPEDQVVDIGEDFQMYSCGWANPRRGTRPGRCPTMSSNGTSSSISWAWSGRSEPSLTSTPHRSALDSTVPRCSMPISSPSYAADRLRWTTSAPTRCER